MCSRAGPLARSITVVRSAQRRAAVRCPLLAPGPVAHKAIPGTRRSPRQSRSSDELTPRPVSRPRPPRSLCCGRSPRTRWGIARRPELVPAKAGMEDPVEAGARQEHDVGVLQCQGARPRNGQRMVVRHHALAHRRARERNLRAFEEGAHFVLGATTPCPCRRRRAAAHPFRAGSRRLDFLRDPGGRA